MNRFGIDKRTTADVDRESRAAAVQMLYAAIEGLPCEQAMRAVVAAIKDCDRFTPDQIETMANELGREAHLRARTLGGL